jgi:carbamoyl-phosphate synthase small subunit
MIGNYGASDKLLESDIVHSRAMVVREIKNTNWNATCPEAWVDWLEGRGIVGVAGIDTRALTRRIRELGAMTACVAAGPDLRLADLLAATQAHPSMAGCDLASEVTCREPYTWGDEAAPYRVVAFDYGIKRSILRNLSAVGCHVTVVPAFWKAEQVLELGPDGVFLSNGPGDPAAVGYAVDTIRGLLGRVPIFGICLGHQLLALAVGFSTYKLKFGHRGINHPVRNYETGRIEITSQNHGFAVEPPALVLEAQRAGRDLASLDTAAMVLESDRGPVRVTHLNLNDGTVEGLRLLDVQAYSVQYHPEAGPGPHDSHYLFQQFVESMQQNPRRAVCVG